MIGIVITGHGSFPNGMLQSIQLIAGEIKNIEVIPFEDDQDKLEVSLRNAIKKVDTGSGVICFADLAGGTPFNVSSRIAVQQENVRVIGGVNTPMLLSAIFQREQPIEVFVDKVILDGRENIKEFKVKKKDVQTEDNGI